MALTLNGRRTGRAGAQELAEQRAEIYAGQEKQADCLEDKFFVLRDALQWLDPQGWSRWYDEHVPDWLGWNNSRPAVEVMRARAMELARERDLFNGQDEADVDRFLEVMEGLHESSAARTEI